MKMMTLIALWLCFRGPRDSKMRSKCVQNGEKGAAKKKHENNKNRFPTGPGREKKGTHHFREIIAPKGKIPAWPARGAGPL